MKRWLVAALAVMLPGSATLAAPSAEISDFYGHWQGEKLVAPAGLDFQADDLDVQARLRLAGDDRRAAAYGASIFTFTKDHHGPGRSGRCRICAAACCQSLFVASQGRDRAADRSHGGPSGSA